VTSPRLTAHMRARKSACSAETLVLPKNNQKGGEMELLSRDCDGCSQMKPCSRRYFIVEKGEKVYCPDGTAHLVDGL